MHTVIHIYLFFLHVFMFVVIRSAEPPYIAAEFVIDMYLREKTCWLKVRADELWIIKHRRTFSFDSAILSH